MEFFSFQQKVNLARSLVLKKSPAYVQFYITARCNLACEQCNIIYAHSDSQEMNIEQIQKTASNLAKIGVCIVLLIGGEPFIRKDIAQIVKAFTDVGIHVRLQTNGAATREALTKCVEYGAHDISISLDSLDSGLQDTINGEYNNSWERAIKTISNVNEIFPTNGTAFFGTVLMPRNLDHIRDVIEFATKIGWGVSLVPAHVSDPSKPKGFRTFDDDRVCTFKKQDYPHVKRVLEDVKALRNSGFNVYDSDEYLDDIYRFITGEPLHWRSRNHNVCDSPNLYFAIEPNGDISPCCDFKLNESFPTYHEDFPKLFFSGTIHESVYKFTKNCSGCMYGSYPEITVTARYLNTFFKRLVYFNAPKKPLSKLSSEEMKKVAKEIFVKNFEVRQGKSLSENLNNFGGSNEIG